MNTLELPNSATLPSMSSISAFWKPREASSDSARGLIGAGDVTVEVGRNSLERASAVEHDRTEPGGMRARAHDRHVAVMPFALEEGPARRIFDRLFDLGHDRPPLGNIRALFPQFL